MSKHYFCWALCFTDGFCSTWGASRKNNVLNSGTLFLFKKRIKERIIIANGYSKKIPAYFFMHIVYGKSQQFSVFYNE